MHRSFSEEIKQSYKSFRERARQEIYTLQMYLFWDRSLVFRKKGAI
jgi:hypothetical protein